MRIHPVNRHQNALTSFLSLLKVKFTFNYANSLYNEHPNKDSLYAISDLLDKYKIDNQALMLSDKNDIVSIQGPFIAYFEHEFIVVTKTSNTSIQGIHHGSKIEIPINVFFDLWNGIVLIAETNKESMEPDYSLNIKLEIFPLFLKFILIILITLALILITSKKAIYEIDLVLLLVSNFIGLYVSSLLIFKQLNITSSHADKICSLFSYSSCNDVLTSKESKIFGLFSWSEVGFSFFVSNLAIILLFPVNIKLFGCISLLALPFSFWSVWVQKIRIKQWCPLCLIVLIILWVNFIICWSWSNIGIPYFDVKEVLVYSIVYTCPFIITHLFIPLLENKELTQRTRQKLNSIRMNEDVILALIKKKRFETKGITSVLWGNENTKFTITIISNPLCTPCSKLHRKLDLIYGSLGQDVCVQFIFTSFTGYSIGARYLIAAYFRSDISKTQQIYSAWYEHDKYDLDNAVERYHLDLDKLSVIAEQERHEDWAKTNNITSTPTLLLNGYLIPDLYSIEDIPSIINAIKDKWGINNV